MRTIHEIANKMVTPGMGILAADESEGTIKKRFDSINVENTEDNRRDYRSMIFQGEAMKDAISGVILFEETLFQKGADGTDLIDQILAVDAVPGIKVDKGAKALPNRPGETVTEGLDGLRERLAVYRARGARFAKWRAVISIHDTAPSWNTIKSNAHALARYAALCQEADIVPIVEPEVSMDGPNARHSIERCEEVTRMALKAVFSELSEADVDLEAIVLKPNMVVPGQHFGQSVSVEEVAERTVRTLMREVPAAVPGIAFLSGGQSDVEATAHLNAMNAGYNTPWALTYSYGRALQAAALTAWKGEEANRLAAQNAFNHRARMNGLASLGKWSADLEK